MSCALCQDYFDIVKHPMDLETVVKKLEHKPERGIVRQYREPAEFREDVRQIWTNCRLYNAVNTPVRTMVRPSHSARAAFPAMLCDFLSCRHRCASGTLAGEWDVVHASECARRCGVIDMIECWYVICCLFYWSLFVLLHCGGALTGAKTA